MVRDQLWWICKHWRQVQVKILKKKVSRREGEIVDKKSDVKFGRLWLTKRTTHMVAALQWKFWQTGRSPHKYRRTFMDQNRCTGSDRKRNSKCNCFSHSNKIVLSIKVRGSFFLLVIIFFADTRPLPKLNFVWRSDWRQYAQWSTQNPKLVELHGRERIQLFQSWESV